MDATSDLLTWLESLDLFPDLPIRDPLNPTSLSREFITGIASSALMLPFLKRLNRLKVLFTQNGLERDTTPNPALRKVVEAAGLPGNTKHREKYWKVLAAAFEPYGLNFTSRASEVCKGVVPSILSLLSDLHSVISPLSKPSKSSVSLDTLDTDKVLFQSDSCIEFFLLSFCSSFDLKPKQAAGLLAQGNKVLKQIIIKGLKGDFEPVLLWYQSVYQNTERLSDLIQYEIEKNAVNFALGSLKYGLESRNEEVVQWTLKTYAKIVLDMEERGIMMQSWNWFVSPQSCLGQILGVIERLGGEIGSNAVETMLHFAQFNMVEFFSMHLKNLVVEAKEYYALLATMLPAIKEMDWACESLLSSRIPQYWTESLLREAEDPSSPCRLTSLHFFSLLWTLFLLDTEEAQSSFLSLISTLKKAFRDSNFLIKATGLSLLLKLLDDLADLKSPYAANVYKTLTLLMVEMDPMDEIRELVVENVRRLVDCTPTIPVQVLIEPWCKRIQSTDPVYPLTIPDFGLLFALARHAKLAIKSGIQLIDVLGKVYISDVLMAKAALGPISTLVMRFVDTDAMQEYLLAFLKFGFSLAANSDKVAKERRKRYERVSLYYTDDAKSETLDHIRKRDSIFEFTDWILQLQNDTLNLKIRDLLVNAVMEYREKTGSDCKGFIMLLGTFGEPITAITAHMRAKEQSPSMGELKSRTQFVNSSLEEVQERSLPHLKGLPESTKHPFPWKRAAQDIEQAKKKAKDREQKLKEEEEMARKRLEIKLGKVALALEVRKVEQGMTRSPAELTLFQEGLATKLLTPQAEITLKEYSEEEKDQQSAVLMVLKRYLRVFKVLFERYSGSGFARKHNTTADIDWLAERKNRLFDTEMVSILIDHKIIPKLMTKEELRDIFKAFCSKIAHQTELNWVNFEGFQGVFCQIAYFVYSREPQDLTHLPGVASVKALIETFRRETKAQGQSVEVYDDPDPGTGDKDVVKELTKMLAKDPEMQLPVGYKRVLDHDVSVVYEIPAILSLPDTLQVAMESLDHILNVSLGLHFLEPQILLTPFYRAKGIALKKERVELPPIQDRPNSLLKRKIREHIEDKPKPTMPFSTPARLGPTLKLAIAKSNEEDQAAMREVAELLEDMLHSVSLGASRVVLRDAAKVRPGPETEDKHQKREIDPKLREKRKIKQAFLHSQLQKSIEERQKKQAAKAAADKEALIKAKNQAKQRAIRLQQDRESRRKQLADILAQRESEALKKRENDAKLQAQNEEINKKKHEEMRRKMEEKLKEVLVKKRQEAVAKRTVNAKVSLLEELNEGKKRFERLFSEDKKKLEVTNKRKEEIKTFTESDETKAVLMSQKRQIDQMFSFYCKQSPTKLEQLPENLLNELKKVDFVKCLNQLQVSPQLVSNDTIVAIFNSLTKEKWRKMGVPATLSKDEFMTALVRIASEARDKLNELHGNTSDELKQSGSERGDGSLTVQTLRNLLVWMDLTLTPRELEEKLKRLQSVSKHPKKGLKLSATQKILKVEEELPTHVKAEEPGPSTSIDDLHLVHRSSQSPH